MGRFVATYLASLFCFLVLGFGLLAFAGWKLEHRAAPDFCGLPAPSALLPVPQPVPQPAKAPREAAKAPRKAAKEPATVTEARRWSACHGPACYHDVRPEAAPFLDKGL